MIKALLGFLFGKQTNIFNPKGRVEHDLGNKKWEAWNNRLSENPRYNWKKHSGKTPQSKEKDSAESPSA